MCKNLSYFIINFTLKDFDTLGSILTGECSVSKLRRTWAVLTQRQLQKRRRPLQERHGQSHFLTCVSQNLHLRAINMLIHLLEWMCHSFCSISQAFKGWVKITDTLVLKTEHRDKGYRPVHCFVKTALIELKYYLEKMKHTTSSWR